MAATLRVDPSRLHTAAAAQAEVGNFVSGMGAGEKLSSAATAVQGLLSGSACEFAGQVLDMACTQVSDELAAHSQNLTAAAGAYQRSDENLGRRLRRTVPPA